MNVYQSIEQIKEYLDLAKQFKLTSDEKKKAAIELAELLLSISLDIQDDTEQSQHKKRDRLVKRPRLKLFFMSVTDQFFRSKSPKRIYNQVCYLAKRYHVFRVLPLLDACLLRLFILFFRVYPRGILRLFMHRVIREFSSFLLPLNSRDLTKRLSELGHKGIQVNLSVLGESILTTKQSTMQLEQYVDLLTRPDVSWISVKISSLCVSRSAIQFDAMKHQIMAALRRLYKTAMGNKLPIKDGVAQSKMVVIDMESVQDLDLTISAFFEVLSEPEFLDYGPGIVLQTYLPDSFLIQQQLVNWSLARLEKGGVPIYLRLVKGANLHYERVHASCSNWTQPTYHTKQEVDANFKRMIHYACQPKHAYAVRLGVGSHNMFDIAYALMERAERNVEPYVSFEMLYGMSDHFRKALHLFLDDVVLYTPIASTDSLHNAIAYLMRRFDENTQPNHFLAHSYRLQPGSYMCHQQELQFSQSFDAMPQLEALSTYRVQNRQDTSPHPVDFSYYKPDPYTDWSLAHNRSWILGVLDQYRHQSFSPITLDLGASSRRSSTDCIDCFSPSSPSTPLYAVEYLPKSHINTVIVNAKHAAIDWKQLGINDRESIMAQLITRLHQTRGDLISLMVLDVGKPVEEADLEVSEAIDFVQYYQYSISKLLHDHPDILFAPKGIVLVTAPWNFPCAIPVGMIVSALITGNVVLFKPAPESVLIGHKLCELFWQAGVPKKALQFIPCDEDNVGSALISDERISTIMLTGSTQTADHFIKCRPDVDLIAECGGKNCMVITDMADRNQAIYDFVQSAFSYSGQKCSAANLLLLEAPVYDDPEFMALLKETVSSLNVGLPDDLATDIGPLIHHPTGPLKRVMSTLDPGEEWLLKPSIDPKNPLLMHPGIKLHVTPNSFMHQNELFGPIIGVMRVESLDDAINVVNGTPYGLTSGLHSLDTREHDRWLSGVDVGNYYINRTTTGAVVGRQPFGGFKASSFGLGFKAGGPFYLTQLLTLTDKPGAQDDAHPIVLDNRLLSFLTKHLLPQLSTEETSVWWHYLTHILAAHPDLFQRQDLSPVIGQDNYYAFRPFPLLILRFKHTSIVDQCRVIAAAIVSGSPFHISVSKDTTFFMDPTLFSHRIKQPVFVESDTDLASRLHREPKGFRVRLLHRPSHTLRTKIIKARGTCVWDCVLSDGMMELSRYGREVVESISYHRYGHCGDRS